MKEAGVDVLVATSPKNVFYTTGVWTTPTVTPGAENYRYTGRYHDYAPPKTFGVWSVDGDAPATVIPPVVAMDIAEENIDLDIPDENVHVYETKRIKPADSASMSRHDRRVVDLLAEGYADRRSALAAALEPMVEGVMTVAVETARPRGFVEDAIVDAVGHQRFLGADRLLQAMRLSKTDEEVERLRTAAAINLRAINASVETIHEGMPERELATTYKQRVYELGAIEQQPFEHTMIGFGGHSAYPHVVPGDREVRPGDIVRFEVGCRYEHYPADLARTYVFSESRDAYADIYRILKRGIDRAVELLGEHLDAADVHRQTIEHVQSTAAAEGVAGLEDFTMTMIGHNIGLDIHDPPLLSAVEAPIEAGYVMNVELSHKMFGEGTIQVEDTVVVTEDGVDRVTNAPDTLPVIEG